MKNTLIKAFLTLFFISCSSDDDSANPIAEGLKTGPKRLQGMSENQVGELVTFAEYNFSFNVKKQLNRIEISGVFGSNKVEFHLWK